MTVLKNLSYILTIIIAITGWILANYVERLQSTPLIKYSVESINDKSSLHWKSQRSCVIGADIKSLSLYKFTIKNLSTSIKFDNVKFHIKNKMDSSVSKIVSSRIIPHAPATAGDEVSVCNNESSTYSDLTFHPNGVIDLIVGFDTNQGYPYILIGNTIDPDKGNLTPPMNLQEENLRTLLVENEEGIIGLFMVLILIIFGRMCFTTQEVL